MTDSTGNEPRTLTRSMHAVSTLYLRTVSNSGPQSNDRWPILLLAGLSDCVVNASKITTNPSVWDPQ